MRALAAALAVAALVAAACVSPARAQGSPSQWLPTSSDWEVASTTTTVFSTAAYAPRAYASAAALNDNGGILLTGGVSGYRYGTYPPAADALIPVGTGAVLYGDGLRSRDGGVTWQQVNSYAANPWYYSYGNNVFSPRALHASVPLRTAAWDDRTFIYGGLTYGAGSGGGSANADTILADAWTVSSDCVVWNRITSSATPGPRAGHALLSFPYDGPRAANAPVGHYFLLIGGASALNSAKADVWLSSDAGNWWYRAHDSTGTFGARAGHAAVAISGVPYVMGGFRAAGVGLDDVWRATDGGATAWVQVSPVWRGYPYAQAYTMAVSAAVKQCVVSGSGAGSWVPAYDLTLVAGGERAPNTKDATGSIAVTTNSTAAPLSQSQWHLGVANLVGPSAGSLPFGVAGVYTGGYFVAIGGSGGSGGSSFTGTVKRLPSIAYDQLLPTGSSSSFPSGCAAGSYGCGSTCTACPAGTYSLGGAVSCTPCPVGTAAASYSGSAQCTQCAPGMVADTAGSSQCRQCPSGSTPNDQRTQCVYGSGGNGGTGGGGGGSSSSRLSKGAIAGIVIGGVGFVAIVIALCCLRKPARPAAAGVVAAASPGSAAGLGMLSDAPAGAAVVVVYPGASAAKSPRYVPAPSAPAVAYGGSAVDGRVVVVRTGDANVSSWQSLF